MPSFSCWKSLEKAVIRANNNAMKMVVDNSLSIARKYTNRFYEKPAGYPGGKPGHYQRTFMLARSPQIKFSTMGTTASGEVSLDTDYKYPDTDISTQEIYNLAETEDKKRKIQGKGEFWDDTKIDVEKEIQKVYGSMFSKK